jgi:hypothetical protein
MDLDGIHRVVAYGTVAITLVGFGWTAILVVADRDGGSAFEQFQAAAVSVLIVAAASGLVLLAVGARPAEGVHLLYAAVAIAVVPLARSFLGRTKGLARVAIFLAAFVVLGGIEYRLFTTG